MRRTLPLVTVATLACSALVLAVVPPAAAEHSWGSYHWSKPGATLPLPLGDNVDETWQEHYVQTSLDWNAPLPAGTTAILATEPVAGLTTGKRCRATDGRVEVCNAAYGANGWLGLAQIWLSGPHITKGVAKLNDTYFAMDRYNDPSYRQHVMCQEVGHTFGLGHTSEDGSTQGTCMDYWTHPTYNDGISVAPNEHDFAQIAAIYEHADEQVTSSPKKGQGRNGTDVAEERSSWGAEVARSANGNRSTFVRDLGEGQRLVTHVTWAQDSPRDKGHTRH